MNAIKADDARYDDDKIFTAGEKDIENFMKALKARKLCGICDGWGHWGKSCSTSRTIKKYADDLGLKAVWGGMKSKAVAAEIRERVKETHKRQKNVMVLKTNKRVGNPAAR